VATREEARGERQEARGGQQSQQNKKSSKKANGQYVVCRGNMVV
jgi:hypothetical protein